MADKKKQLGLGQFLKFRENVNEKSSKKTEEIRDKSNSSTVSDTEAASPKKPKVSRVFRTEWLSKFLWLRYERGTGGMTCDICLNAKQNNPFVQGCTNYQHSTLTRHEQSKDHVDSIKILELQRQFETAKANVQNVVEDNRNAQTESHVKQLRTVYVMAKRNISSDAFGDLMEMQVENGISNCNNFYRKHGIVDEMEQCVFDVLEKNQIKAIRDSPFFGVMLDETCDVNVEKKLAIYVRYVDVNTGEVKVGFAGNEHVHDCTAAGIEESLIEFLHRKHLVNENNDNFYRVMGLGTDGAAVMTGRLNGLGARLKRRNPKLVQVHCAAHRLNLAASQAARDVPYLNDYHRHIGILYRYYTDSSVKYDKLRELQDLLHGNRRQVQEPTSVRWLSVEAAVKMIMQTYDAIIMSLEDVHAVRDPKAVGLHNFMASSLFILVTALLLDVLSVIGILSLTFQKDKVNLSAVRHCVNATMETLETMKQGSHHVNTVLQDLGAPQQGQKTNYKNVEVVDNGPMRDRFNSLRVNYIKSLKNKLSERFPQDDLDILECFDMLLNPSRYPDDLVTYGQEQLEKLLENYGELLQRDRALNQFLLFKHYVRGYKGVFTFDQLCKHLIRDDADTYPDFVKLAILACIIPVSSAPCERGFSVQNAIKNPVRNRLTNQRLNRLMFIRLQGPPRVTQFDFGKAVELFQTRERRK